MGQIKVTPEQLAKIKEFGADGVFDEKEKTELEKLKLSDEIMQAINSGSLIVEGDLVTITKTKSPQEAKGTEKTQEEAPSFWKNPIDWFTSDKVPTTKKVLAGAGIAAAAICAVAAASAPAATLAVGKTVGSLLFSKPVLTAASAAFMAGAAGVASTSCESGDVIVDFKLEAKTQVVLNITATNSNEEIVKAVNDLKGTISDYMQKQDEYNKAILNELIRCGISLDRIVEMLEKLGLSMDMIIDLVKGLTDIADDTKNKLTDLLTEVKNGNKIGAENYKVLMAILSQLNNIGTANEDIKKLLNEIAAKIDKNTDMTEKQSDILVAILAKLNSMDRNIANKLMVILDSIDSMGKHNYEILKQILNAIEEGKDDNNALLEKILDEVINASKENKDMNVKMYELMQQILKSVKNLDKSMSTALSNLIGSVDELNAENKALLNAILSKLGEMDAGNQQNFAKMLSSVEELNKTNKEGVKILTKILEKLNKMDASTQASFNAVIGMLMSGNTINAQILAKLDKILNKLDKIDANQANFFNQVLVNFDKLDKNQQANVDKILGAIENNTAAINNNTQISKGIYALLTQLLGKVDELKNDSNVNVTAILDAIANISVGNGGNVDLTTIENLLKELTTQGAKNNEVLNSINAKIAALTIVIGGLQAEWKDASDEIKKLLQQILDKIPPGCDCEHQDVDLSEIIKLLKELVDASKKDGVDDSKHEGILDDLDNLFD